MQLPKLKVTILDPIAPSNSNIYRGPESLRWDSLDAPWALRAPLHRAHASSRFSSATPSVGVEEDTRWSMLIRWHVGTLPRYKPLRPLLVKSPVSSPSPPPPYFPYPQSFPSRSAVVSFHPLGSRDSVFLPLGAEWIVASPPKFFRLYTLGSCYGTWECSQAWKPRSHRTMKTRAATDRVWCA